MGRRRWGLGLRVGSSGRYRVDRQHPLCDRARASTGSTPQRCTAWVTPRRSCGERLRPFLQPTGPTSSPSAGWCGMRPVRTAPPRQVLQPESIRRECEASLRRLGVETNRPVSVSLARSDRHRGRGFVGGDGEARRRGKGSLGVGVSNFDVDLLRRCEAVRHVDSLQPPLSLIRRQAAEAEIPWCAAHGTGVIVYSPLQSGLLTERFSAERVEALAPDDWRRRSPEFKAPEAGAQSRAARCAAAGSQPLRYHGERGGHRLDPGMARCHRSDRGGAFSRAGGWMDRRGDPGAHA